MVAAHTPDGFVAKWRDIEQKEVSVVREHFIDLCRMLGQPTPTEVDPLGHTYAFEPKVKKVTGKNGFADVWRRGYFAWEYKGKRANLEAAYLQLLLYREHLENPPLLTVCDTERFEIHTNFTGTPKKVYRITLDDLPKPENLEVLHYLFTDPERLNPKYQRERVTKDATAKLGALAHRLQARGYSPEEVAHFTTRLVFALFAEDVKLLPNDVFKKILEKTRHNPKVAKRYFDELFAAMATGGVAALEEIPYFNGGLFNGGEALELEPQELGVIYEAAELDWSEVEPAIFGTLFERSLDPAKRSQLGAHYTSREDILRVVEPVITEPLRAEWQEVRVNVEKYLESNPLPDERSLDRKRLAPFNALKRQHDERSHRPIAAFLERLRDIKVLDGACGSGNFLYVAFQQLKELERDVLAFAQSVGYPQAPFVSPRQFYGFEVNVFAYELASIVVWIGYLQWNHLNGFSNRQVPVLERLDNIKLQDALLNSDQETEWPEVDYIVGNPPFLGDRKMRRQLGHAYVERLRELFKGRIPGSSDLVCYWFEKARTQVVLGKARRVGLIATNSIATGENSKVLANIKTSGDIFMAWSDEPWVLEGAAVRVSLIAFDNGTERARTLNGNTVSSITPFLTQGTDLSLAKRLSGNDKRSFIGIQKGGAFDIPEQIARDWLGLPNPNGVSNSDVLKPYLNGMDITNKARGMWVIDFAQMSEAQAAEYVVPFAYVRTHVKPERDLARRDNHRIYWWRHHDTRPALRQALSPLARYLCSSIVAKHRVWTFQSVSVLPDKALVVVAADDYFTFGILQSKMHELWSLGLGTSLEDRPRYTPSTCFETFPFPSVTEEQRREIEKWAKLLDDTRNHFLTANSTLTMTKLYNELGKLRRGATGLQAAFALLAAHDKLDAAAATAYGWEWPLSDEEVLAKLLDENLRRSPAGVGPSVETSETLLEEHVAHSAL